MLQKQVQALNGQECRVSLCNPWPQAKPLPHSAIEFWPAATG